MPEGAITELVRYYHDNPNSTRYTDNNGIPGTHEALAEFLNQTHTGSGIKFDPSWVQYSPGAIKRLLAEFVPTLLFEDGTDLFFPTPSYEVIKSAMNRRGATVHDVPLILSNGRWYVDYDAIKRKLTGKKSVLYLNSPHNPTGTTLSRIEKVGVIKWATENNVTVIVDEAYSHLRLDKSESFLDIAGWEQCCIVLQSVSKGWSATGIRFGWVIAHPTVIKALRKVMDVKDSGGFGPCIAASLWCLKHPEIASATRDRYRGLHQTLLDGLQSVGFQTSMPEAGLCQFMKAPKAVNGVAFKDSIECAQWFRNNLRISLMHASPNGIPHLRWAVTIGAVPECDLPDEAAVIAEVVRRLKSAKLEF
jgi:LL-diaminopimelate aminotransferase